MIFHPGLKRIIAIATLFAVTFFLAGYFERYHIPKIKRWILSEIEKQSEKHSPIRIWPKNIKISVLPIGAIFYNVRLLPKPELSKQLSPTSIEKVEISLSPWALFKGEMRLSKIVIENANFDINMNLKPVSGANYRRDFSLNDLDLIPIDKIVLKKINLNAKNALQENSSTLNNLNLTIENRYQTLRVDLGVDTLNLYSAKKAELFSARISTQFLLDDDGLYVSNIHLGRQQNQIQASGAITGDILNQKFKDVNAKIIGDLSLDDLSYFKKYLTDFSKIKSTAGSVQFETDFKYNFKKTYRANFALKTENLYINQFNIGQLMLVGKASEQDLVFTKFAIQNKFGLIAVNDFNLQTIETIKFKGAISTDALNMNVFLASLGLSNVPVQSTISGQLPCEGTLSKKISIVCNGQINGKDFSVIRKRKTSDAAPIVSFNNYSIIGSLHIDESDVRYKTSLRIGKSEGESSGTISYQNGFKIDYSTSQLNFSDISDLAQLRPEGQIAVKGVTSGNSRSATISLNASGENFWLKDFALGKSNFSFIYDKGTIEVKKIEGQLNKMRYTGNLTIHLPSEKLQLSAAIPFLDAEDLASVFKRKVQPPFVFTGTGSASISVSGPFKFNLLSYDLISTLYRGTIANESYDQLNFNIKSENGHVKSKLIELARGSSRIKATGHVEPDGIINLDILGRNFKIEQFENLSRLKLNLTGNLDFDTKLTNHILNPDLYFKGHVTKTMVDSIPAKDSEIEFKVTETEMSGNLKFMGPAVAAQIKHSRDKKGETHLHIAVEKWDFAQIFSIFTDSLRDGNYQTNLTGNLDMTLPNDNIYKFSGSLNVQEFKVKNGSVEMSSPQPHSLTAKNGILTSKNFEIAGENTYLRLRTSSTSSDNLGLTLEGRINLALAVLFTPFMNDLRGTMNLSYELSGTYKNPQFNGSAFLEDGFFKIKGFPHSFEEVISDASFNNKKIIINTVKGKLASGRFSGQGDIDVQSASKIPVNILGEFQDVKMNIPEGFSTRGDGNYFIRGDSFPFTIGVNYSVVAGSIERKTSEFSKNLNTVKPSSYLPKFLSAKRFTPITLDLNINLKKNIPVRMSISRIDVRTDVIGQMRVQGPPENPLLTGKINISRGGKVTFRNNVFEIKNGYVEYIDSPPDNPMLNIQANSVVRAQLRDGRTRDYDVDLFVQGTASKPKITMSSQPPLIENDLISLLTLGFINDETLDDGETTAGEKLANTSYQLTSAFLNENLGINQVLEKQLGLHFDISSSYDSSDKAEKHKLILSKQWTPKFGTSASRQIGKINSNNVKAEYKLNKNLSLIGQWEGKEPTGAEQQTTSDKDLNIFGLDMEYKVDFR